MGVADLGALRKALVSRGGAWEQELGQARNVRMAVNQDMAAANAPLNPGDEIAFFPPVTGG